MKKRKMYLKPKCVIIEIISETPSATTHSSGGVKSISSPGIVTNDKAETKSFTQKDVHPWISTKND